MYNKKSAKAQTKRYRISIFYYVLPAKITRDLKSIGDVEVR